MNFTRSCAAALVMGALMAVTSAPAATPAGAAPTLDGLAFAGHIRATGWRGLFSVRGTLSFADGQLLWTTGDTTDAAPVMVTTDGAMLRFRSHQVNARGEDVVWTGVVDGRTLRQAQAEWTRRPGDWVHDLLLPPVMTMHFTPDSDAVADDGARPLRPGPRSWRAHA